MHEEKKTGLLQENEYPAEWLLNEIRYSPEGVSIGPVAGVRRQAAYLRTITAFPEDTATAYGRQEQ